MIYALPPLFTPEMTQGVMSRRVVAWWCDLVLIGVIWGLLALLMLALGIMTLGLSLPLLATLPLVPFLYNFLWLASPAAATPGQRLLGLSVRDASTLYRPGVVQALISTIGFELTLATSGLWLLVALITERHRTLHDLVSGLVVVRAQRLTASPASWTMAGG